MASYLTSMASHQLNASPDTAPETHRNLEDIETFYAILFTFELLLNLFGNWWRPFAREIWNWL
jgi:hypothetical protein